MAHRILYLDIETRPMVAEVWGLRKQNIGLNQVREFGGTLCVGMKWGGQRRVDLVSDWEHGHEAMLRAIYDRWQEADALCGYNSDRFDIRKLKADFVKAGFDPPKPVASIDVFKTVRREFFFDSMKLDHVAHLLGVGRKIQHEGHGLWMKVLQGDEKAQRMMARYCKQDVRLLEEVYNKLLPWISTHPHLNDNAGCNCANCGGSLTSQGWKRTKHFKVQSLKCTGCGSWSQGKREKVA